MMSILTIALGWADDVALTWSGNGSSDSNSTLDKSKVLTTDANYTGETGIATCTDATNIYVASDGLKLGKSSAVGNLTFSFSNGLKPTKITVSARKYSNDTGKLTITAGDKSISQAPSSSTSYDDIVLNMDGNTELSTLSLATTSKRAYINSITITYGVAPAVATPTFSPVAGTYYESQRVTISCETEGADILWGYNGETFGSYDGDPILVNESMTLYAYAMKSGMTDSEVASAAYTIASIETVTPPYEEDFSNGFGKFYTNNKTDPGFDVWKTGSYNNTTYAKASGYSGGAKESESWLITPYIDLSSASAPQLSFSQAIDNHFGTLSEEATLWIKEKTATEWTQKTISYPEIPETSYSDFVAQTIDLSAYVGKTIQIAFKYKSSTSAAGNWEVSNFRVGEPVAEKAYYLKGSFNNWGDGIAFEKVNDNMFILRNQEITANMEFKILNENNEYLGGQDGSDPYNITNSWFRNLPLEKGKEKNFCIVNAGTYDFIIKIADGIATLFVPQTTDLYLKGSFDTWGEGAKFTRNEDGSYTLEGKVIEEAAEFKIYDAIGNGIWYPTSDVTSFTANETTATLRENYENSPNCNIVAGKWTFNIDIAKTTMVVSRVLATHNITLDTVENGTLSIEGDKTTAVVGEIVKVIAKPAPDYQLGKISVSAGDDRIEVSEENTFVMPDADVIVSADFEEIEIPVGDYKKVTSNEDLTDGYYLIVYETDSLALDGSLETLDTSNNTIEVEIKGNMIVSTKDVDAAKFYCNPAEGTIMNAGGYYIGQTSDANGLKISATDVYTNTLSIDNDGNAVIVASGGPYLRYNSTSGQERFRYFKSSTYSSQKAIQLYKKTDEFAPSLPTPEINGETPFVGTTVVTIVGGTEFGEIHYTLDGSEPTRESALCDDVIILDKTTTVKAIVYKHIGEGEYEFSAVAIKTFVKAEEVANLTEFYAYNSEDPFGFTGDLVAIAQTGQYLYAQEESKGVLIYGTIDKTYSKGDKIPGGFFAKKGAYHGASQMTEPSGMKATTGPVSIEPVALTISQITVDNFARYAVVNGATITSETVNDKTSYYLNVGEDKVVIFDRFSIPLPDDYEGKTYNVIGISGWYDGAQFIPLDYKEKVEPVVLEGVSFGDGHKWATWYDEEDYAKPEGVKVYVVSKVNETSVEVEEINYLPSMVGVLLYSEDEMESVSAMPCESGADAESELKGVVEEQYVDNSYVLYNNEFVLLQSDTKLAAHRCYLPIPEEEDVTSAPRVLRIVTAGTVTAIDDLRYDRNGNPVGYYDLTGRYVGTSLSGKRGIFITSDGKKVVR